MKRQQGIIHLMVESVALRSVGGLSSIVLVALLLLWEVENERQKFPLVA